MPQAPLKGRSARRMVGVGRACLALCGSRCLHFSTAENSWCRQRVSQNARDSRTCSLQRGSGVHCYPGGRGGNGPSFCSQKQHFPCFWTWASSAKSGVGENFPPVAANSTVTLQNGFPEHLACSCTLRARRYKGNGVGGGREGERKLSQAHFSILQLCQWVYTLEETESLTQF